MARGAGAPRSRKPRTSKNRAAADSKAADDEQQAMAAKVARGELDFFGMLAEAAVPRTLRLQHSKPPVEFKSDALQRISPTASSLRARCRASRPVKAGELLLAVPPLAFATYDELSAGTHQLLVEKTMEATQEDPKTLTRLQELSGASEVNELVIRETLQRNCCACTTGVGLWHAVSFLNHSTCANATRFYIADWALVRATQDISAGVEVTLSYVDPTADYAPQVGWLESLGMRDEALCAQAVRWERCTDMTQEDDTTVVRAIKASLEGLDNPLQSLGTPIARGPCTEQRHYLLLLESERGRCWCWGQMVRWLRNEQLAQRERGEARRALGAALAIAELTERHVFNCVSILHAWGDCAAMLFDMSESASDEEQVEAMELCIDGVQRGIEFLFGENWAEDTDFSTLVLEWATSRWWHAAAWQQSVAKDAAHAAESSSCGQDDQQTPNSEALAEDLNGMD